MKVFLSWSGNQSHLLAQALKDWLPSVFQSLKPFLSSRDINAGVQWFPKLKSELEAADFGIVCLTSTNLTAPYIMLESGAMAMRVEAARLVPVLCDVAETELGKNPLTAFNYVHLTKEGIFKLAESINVSLGENKLEQLKKTFDKWWPDLEERIKVVISTPGEDAPKKKIDLEDSVEEMLSMLRTLIRKSEVPSPSIRKPIQTTARVKFAGLPEIKLQGEKSEVEAALTIMRRNFPRPFDFDQEGPSPSDNNS